MNAKALALLATCLLMIVVVVTIGYTLARPRLNKREAPGVINGTVIEGEENDHGTTWDDGMLKILSDRPSVTPSSSPSLRPSQVPSMWPSGWPSDLPSSFPSDEPSRSPTNHPTLQPIDPNRSFRLRMHWKMEYMWQEGASLGIQLMIPTAA